VGDVGPPGSGFSAGLHQGVAIQLGVNPSLIVIIIECGELSLEVKVVPE
jgi:hypothetical protein